MQRLLNSMSKVDCLTPMSGAGLAQPLQAPSCKDSQTACRKLIVSHPCQDSQLTKRIAHSLEATHRAIELSHRSLVPDTRAEFERGGTCVGHHLEFYQLSASSLLFVGMALRALRGARQLLRQASVIQHTQQRAASSHSENTNTFIKEVCICFSASAMHPRFL